MNPPHPREIEAGGGAEGETGVARVGPDRGGCHTGRRLQARMGATSAHEGGLFGSLAARRALVPRWGASLADAKWLLSREGALGSLPFVIGHAKAKGRSSAAPAREGPREGVDAKPTENRSRSCDRSVRGWSRRSLGEQNAPRARDRPTRAHAARRSGGKRSDVIALLPRPRDGSPKPVAPPKAQALGTHREPTSTGARSRGVLGSRHRSDVSKRACST